MSSISENCWCAMWFVSLEEDLPVIVDEVMATGESVIYGQREVTFAEVCVLTR